MKEKLKLWYWNNISRHIQRLRFLRIVKRENLDQQWLDEGKSFELRPSQLKMGKLKMKDVEWANKIIEEISKTEKYIGG